MGIGLECLRADGCEINSFSETAIAYEVAMTSTGAGMAGFGRLACLCMREIIRSIVTWTLLPSSSDAFAVTTEASLLLWWLGPKESTLG